MVGCYVTNCFVRNGKMFAFPKDTELQKKWLVACRKEERTLKSSNNGKVCRRHFAEECIMQHTTKKGRVMLTLKEDSVPTLYLKLEKTAVKRVYSYWSQVDKLKDESPDNLPRTGIPSYEQLRQPFCPMENIPKVSEQKLEYVESHPLCAVVYIPEIIEEKLELLESKETLLTNVSLGNQQEVLRKAKEQIDLLQKRLAAQTEMLAAQKEEIAAQKIQMAVQTAKIQTLEQENAKFKSSYEALESMLTKGQMKRKLHPEHPNSQWSAEDIAPALTLRAKTGGKGYNFLRKERKIPLPCDSTLRNWISDVKVESGLLADATAMHSAVVTELLPLIAD